jgi:hypothetical protein
MIQQKDKQNYLVGDARFLASRVLVVLFCPYHLLVDFFTSFQLPSSYIWPGVLQN